MDSNQSNSSVGDTKVIMSSTEFCCIANTNLDDLIQEQEKVIEDLQLNSPESVGKLSNEIIYKTCLQFAKGYINALYVDIEKKRQNGNQSTDQTKDGCVDSNK